MKDKLNNHTLYVRLTNSCNLKCRHCCYSCGPGGKTMSDQELETVLRNTLGPNVIALLFSGGEVFTSKKTLEKALGYVKEHRQQLQQEFDILPVLKDCPSGNLLRFASQAGIPR